MVVVHCPTMSIGKPPTPFPHHQRLRGKVCKTEVSGAQQAPSPPVFGKLMVWRQSLADVGEGFFFSYLPQHPALLFGKREVPGKQYFRVLWRRTSHYAMTGYSELHLDHERQRQGCANGLAVIVHSISGASRLDRLPNVYRPWDQAVIVSFTCQLEKNLGSPGKRELQLNNCPGQVVLWPCLWDTFFMAHWCGRFWPTVCSILP